MLDFLKAFHFSSTYVFVSMSIKNKRCSHVLNKINTLNQVLSQTAKVAVVRTQTHLNISEHTQS